MTVADFVNEVVEHPSWASLNMKVGWFGDTLNCVNLVQEGRSLVLLADDEEPDDEPDPDDEEDDPDDDGDVDDEDDE